MTSSTSIPPAAATMADGTRILLVEDEPAISEVLAGALGADDRVIVTARSGEEALDAIDTSAYDLVILDLGLPGISGLETLRQIRSRGNDTPVIILTAAEALSERLAGFDLGADDYVVKPTPVAELQRRVTAVLRRAGGTKRFGAQLLGPNGVVVDISARSVRVGTTEVNVSSKQLAVLQYLLEHRGRVMSTEDISITVWGYGTFGSPNFVEAQISRIRSRLAEAGATAVIETTRGAGYVIR